VRWDLSAEWLGLDLPRLGSVLLYSIAVVADVFQQVLLRKLTINNPDNGRVLICVDLHIMRFQGKSDLFLLFKFDAKNST